MSKSDKFVAYQCAYCENAVAVKTDKLKHRPPGYYFAVRRVTEAGNHYTTIGEVYTCNKECAENYVKYGMSRSFEQA